MDLMAARWRVVAPAPVAATLPSGVALLLSFWRRWWIASLGIMTLCIGTLVVRVWRGATAWGRRRGYGALERPHNHGAPTAADLGTRIGGPARGVELELGGRAPLARSRALGAVEARVACARPHAKYAYHHNDNADDDDNGVML